MPKRRVPDKRIEYNVCDLFGGCRDGLLSDAIEFLERLIKDWKKFPADSTLCIDATYEGCYYALITTFKDESDEGRKKREREEKDREARQYNEYIRLKKIYEGENHVSDSK